MESPTLSREKIYFQLEGFYYKSWQKFLNFNSVCGLENFAVELIPMRQQNIYQKLSNNHRSNNINQSPANENYHWRFSNAHPIVVSVVGCPNVDSRVN